jgi:hypothetical protein
MPTQSNFTAITALGPSARSTNANGSAVDLRGYINPGGRNIKAVVSLGTLEGTAGTTLNVAVKIQESDTTTAADFTDVTSATVTLTTTGISEYHFVTAKRYVRAVLTQGANATNHVAAATLIAEDRWA